MLVFYATFNQGVRSSNLRWLTKHKTLKKLDVIGFLRVLCFAFLLFMKCKAPKTDKMSIQKTV